jgi:hypothetical protein
VSYRPTIEALCKADKLPAPVCEYRFAPPRRWRFDFAWLESRVALEVQGGVFVHGRHSRGAALLKEHEKLSTAAAMGWRVVFCTPSTLPTRWPDVVAAIATAEQAAR